ncbi:hypothetical protein NW761_006459 [Fusarium oxysporum]|nr:hypothetical protein NW758_011425 [Fusarium oxysporum]KAJ4049297.1 hypothetical protein NW753_008308 [Fusarium oxysporum]KAJ4049882.1 hypothetical protein NW763_009193 [Fusarium oxysporum]KAJ4090177.1 hypothetical protein NW756_006526 [Fusarium oxysporum]KAJ4092233.1 hypothetical protein NW761_006459 [Fusarium oxysporum]
MDYDLYSLHVSPISSTHPRSTKATRSVLEWVEEQESARCYLEWKSHRHNTWCMERCFGYLDDDSSNDATAENRDQAEEKDWGNCHVRSGPFPYNRQFRSDPKPHSIFNFTEHNRRLRRNNNLVKHRDLRRHDGGMHAWSPSIRPRHYTESETRKRVRWV